MEKEKIKAEELRIGNFVYGHMCELCIVKQVGHQLNDNLVGYISLNHLKSYGQNDQRPIELTDEWLLKGNCQKVNNSTYRRGAFTFQPVNATVDEPDDIIDKILKSKKGFRVCLAGNFICNLFYVHDWQNLHFALSKTELIFQIDDTDYLAI